MKKKQPYSAVAVEKFEVNSVVDAFAEGCILAIDVAKEKFVVALATVAGEVVRTIRFRHPIETELFLKVVMTLLVTLPGKVMAAMEPTGTYGDAIRYQLQKLGVPVKLVSAKRVHDTRELYDGVPSSHDGKSAFLIAKLHATGLSQDWPERSDWVRGIRALVDQRAIYADALERYRGRLEALIMRHWPEFPLFLDVHQQKSALRFLAEFGGPKPVAADPGRARDLLRRASCHMLSEGIINGTIASASITTGAPALESELQLVRVTAKQALEQWEAMGEVEGRIAALGKGTAVYESLRRVVGAVTAAVVIAYTDPLAYANASKFEKACGLNLKEQSSGEHKGRLQITKRGPAIVRQMLYLAALRLIQADPIIRAWYCRRRGYTEESKRRAVVAVMRKLVKALWHVARGSEFDAKRLVDINRLDLTSEMQTTPRDESKRNAVPKRTQPRSSTAGRRSKRSTGGAATATT